MGDTLADLYREVGIESAASRSARQGAPAPLPQRPQPHSAAARRFNQHRRAPAVREDFAVMAPRQAYAPPRNQFAELPQMAAEMTGVPSLARAYEGYQHAQNWPEPWQRTQAMQEANANAVNGVLGVAGWAVPGLRGRAEPMPRMPFPDFGALPEPMPSLRAPPREIGPNGMPIAPRQPFRGSLQGGSADLSEAAAMRTTPDAGDAGGGQSWTDPADIAPRFGQAPRPALPDGGAGGGGQVRETFAERPVPEHMREYGWARNYTIPITEGREASLIVKRDGTVSWTSAGQLEEADALRVMRGVRDALRHDAQTYRPQRYRWQALNFDGEGGGQSRESLYNYLAEKIAPSLGYRETTATALRRALGDMGAPGMEARVYERTPGRLNGGQTRPPDGAKSYRNSKPPTSGALSYRRL